MTGPESSSNWKEGALETNFSVRLERSLVCQRQSEGPVGEYYVARESNHTHLHWHFYLDRDAPTHVLMKGPPPFFCHTTSLISLESVYHVAASSE